MAETLNQPETYYYQQFMKIKKESFSKDYLIQQVMQAKTYIDLNYENNISLNDIAGQVFISKFHFIRIFKNIYGRTPYQYLTSVRINKAKKLLQTDLSVTEVCILVGFESTGSFATLFKKSTGLTPSNFKKNNIPNIPIKN